MIIVNIIQPSPQRIDWCYGQWQPLYDQLSRERPEIEFVRGIPDGLNDSDFISSAQRNLLVFDDLGPVSSTVASQV